MFIFGLGVAKNSRLVTGPRQWQLLGNCKYAILSIIYHWRSTQKKRNTGWQWQLQILKTLAREIENGKEVSSRIQRDNTCECGPEQTLEGPGKSFSCKMPSEKTAMLVLWKTLPSSWLRQIQSPTVKQVMVLGNSYGRIRGRIIPKGNRNSTDRPTESTNLDLETLRDWTTNQRAHSGWP